MHMRYFRQVAQHEVVSHPNYQLPVPVQGTPTIIAVLLVNLHQSSSAMGLCTFRTGDNQQGFLAVYSSSLTQSLFLCTSVRARCEDSRGRLTEANAADVGCGVGSALHIPILINLAEISLIKTLLYNIGPSTRWQSRLI